MNRRDGPIRSGVSAFIESRAPVGVLRLLALTLLVALTACSSQPGPDVGGEGEGDDYLACQDFPVGSTQPELRCASEDGAVALSIPWQGRRVDVDETTGTPQFAGGSEFQPISTSPLAQFQVVEEGSGELVTQFDPPSRLDVRYGSNDFAAANPRVGMGELGLATWDPAQDRWLIIGHGIFESGFWVADPRLGQQNLNLSAMPSERQPRFKISGVEQSGAATALISQTPPTLALAWGSLPFDEGHELVAFEPCATKFDEELGVDVVECVSTTGAVIVRVPYQQGGTIEPRVVALPLNKNETLATPSQPASAATELDRSLINFVVVGDADPTTVLTSFDPPIEYEVVYTPDEIFVPGTGQQFRDLTVNYWDEGTEELVVLGGGNTQECFDAVTEQLKVGCPWGQAAAAMPTDDPTWVRATETAPRFFRMEDAQGNGRAKFYFDSWGDRMVAFGR